MDNPQVITQYQESEYRAGRVVGPLSIEEFPFVHISRFGVIPRVIPKSTPGKWRLIVDMSSQEEGSINDGIQETMCSLSYATVEDATQGIVNYGTGALLIKIDIRYAIDSIFSVLSMAMRIGWYQCTQMTGGLWGCFGKDHYLWIRPFHLDCTLPRRSSQPWQMQQNG